MKTINNETSLWVEKYRPITIDDLITTSGVKSLIKNIIKEKEVPNLLFAGSPGLGKTASAYVICKEIKADYLYINCSLETGIDTLRYKVMTFASTHSLMGGSKVIIMDETDRLTGATMDALKGVIENVYTNCRFIFTTNNLSKIIDPIKSRCQLIQFNYSKTEVKNIILQYFKRCQFILDNEKISFDKQVLADFIQKLYPDFRKIINELQKYSKMQGNIDASIFNTLSGALTEEILENIKQKKFNTLRKIANDIDTSSFYSEFYNIAMESIADESKPEFILILNNYQLQDGMVLDKAINLAAFFTEVLMKIKLK